jgi:hypothetical protein
MLAYASGHVLADATLGWHDCEICGNEDQSGPAREIGPVIHWRGRDLQLYGHGHYLVRSENVVYMVPALVLHYMLAHHYRPPDEFVEAVIVGSFLTSKDLVFIEDEGAAS